MYLPWFGREVASKWDLLSNTNLSLVCCDFKTRQNTSKL